MAEVASAYVSLLPSARGFGKGIDNEIGGDVDASGRRAGKRFGSKLVAGIAAAGIGAAVAKVLSSAVSEASAAEQSLGATESIFGDFSDAIVDQSKRAAKQFGLSANEYRENANLIGSLFKNQGTPLRDLAAETDAMIVKASDLAATFGGSTKEAVEALGSAFKGEFNPLERYGISLRQSTINTEALGLANVKTESEFKKLSVAQQDAAKRQATVNLVMKQSKDATGAFSREASTLAGQQQRLSAQWTDMKARIGAQLLPVLTRLAKYASSTLLPALDDLGDWLSDHRDDFADAGKSIQRALIPPLEALVDIVRESVEFLAGLPGPVKEIGVQAGIAALILPRLTSAVGMVGGAFTAATTATGRFVTALSVAEKRAVLAQGALRRLGGVARTVAGVAGMVAVTRETEKSNNALNSFKNVIGGAGIGFAAGGPWGAAVGAIGGGLKTIYDKATQTKGGLISTFEAPTRAARKYRDTLDQVTGAITRMTRERVRDNLQADGMLDVAAKLGVANRDLVSATLGNEGAQKRLNKALHGQKNAVDIAQMAKLTNWAEKHGIAIERQGKRVRQRTQDLKTWKQALKTIPPAVFTELKQSGFKPSLKQLRELQREYNLTPKQLRTIIKETGADATVKKVKGVNKVLKDTGKTKAEPKVWTGSVQDFLTRGLKRTRKGTDDINKELRTGTGKAKPNLGPFTNSFGNSLTTLSNRASSGGNSIGSNLGAGIRGGIAAWTRAIAGAAIGAVRNAISGARAEAQIKSPSRKTFEIGMQLSKGLENGLKKGAPAAVKKARGLVKEALAAAREELRSTQGEMRDLSRSVRDAFRVDLFQGSIGDFFASGISSVANLKAMRQAFRKLKRMGGSEGFLSDLFASGNVDQIVALAGGSRAQLRQAQSLYTQQNRLSTKLGKSVGRNDLGDEVRGVRAEIRGLRSDLKSLPKDFGKEINRTASKGKRNQRKGAA